MVYKWSYFIGKTKEARLNTGMWLRYINISHPRHQRPLTRNKTPKYCLAIWLECALGLFIEEDRRKRKKGRTQEMKELEAGRQSTGVRSFWSAVTPHNRASYNNSLIIFHVCALSLQCGHFVREHATSYDFVRTVHQRHNVWLRVNRSFLLPRPIASPLLLVEISFLRSPLF